MKKLYQEEVKGVDSLGFHQPNLNILICWFLRTESSILVDQDEIFSYKRTNCEQTKLLS